jgi:hypothetical protein
VGPRGACRLRIFPVNALGGSARLSRTLAQTCECKSLYLPMHSFDRRQHAGVLATALLNFSNEMAAAAERASANIVAVHRRTESRLRIVGRRQMDFLLQRQVRRIQARHRISGRFNTRALHLSAQSDPLLHPLLVARFEKAPLYRHESQSPGPRHRVGPNQSRRRRSVDGPNAHHQPGVVPRFEMGRVFQPPTVPLPRNFHQQRRDR